MQQQTKQSGTTNQKQEKETNKHEEKKMEHDKEKFKYDEVMADKKIEQNKTAPKPSGAKKK